MERVQICKYVKNYSKIEKIQDEYEVDYSADIMENNIFLSVVHIQNPNNYYVKCLCENVNEKQAKNIMLFMYENSIDACGFLDVLQDLSVKYQEVR